MEVYGYARDAKSGESLEKQVHKLMDFGLQIEKIYKERRSSLDGNRPELADCLQKLTYNDILVVTRIDRLARNILHLNQIKITLESKNAHFIVLDQGIDTRYDSNIDFFNMLTIYYEFEMDVRVERQIEGIIKAKNNGVRFGRKPVEKKSISKIIALAEEGESVGQISLKTGLGRSTVYRLIKKNKLII